MEKCQNLLVNVEEKSKVSTYSLENYARLVQLQQKHLGINESHKTFTMQVFYY